MLGPKGERGSPGPGAGPRGKSGQPEMMGIEGESAIVGTQGKKGEKGEKGVASAVPLTNWKQFVMKNLNDDTDNSKIKVRKKTAINENCFE